MYAYVSRKCRYLCLNVGNKSKMLQKKKYGSKLQTPEKLASN